MNVDTGLSTPARNAKVAFQPNAQKTEAKAEPVTKATPVAKELPAAETPTFESWWAEAVKNPKAAMTDLLSRWGTATEEERAQLPALGVLLARQVRNTYAESNAEKAAPFQPKASADTSTMSNAEMETDFLWNSQLADEEGWTHIAPSNKYQRFSEKVRKQMEQAIGNADSFSIRKMRSDRNLYQVVVKGKKGTVSYDGVSPSALRNALSTKEKDGRAFGVARANEIIDAATNLRGRMYDYKKVVEMEVPEVKKPTKEELKKQAGKDTYGRQVSIKMGVYMSESRARTGDSTKGALVPLYTVAYGSGVQNSLDDGMVRVLSDKPSVANTYRGISGADAYAFGGGLGSKIRAIESQLKDVKPGSQKYVKLHGDLAKLEKKNREFTQSITRLDPFRVGYQSAKTGDITDNLSILEVYANIKNPLIVDANGQGRDFCQEIANRLLSQKPTDANQYDGAIIHNANFVAEGQALLGGTSELSTIYLTMYNDQVKSTYNTRPTHSSMIQY